MEPDLFDALLSNIASQFRGPLSSLYMCISRMASADDRRDDPALDAKAAALEQSYFQVLRLANNLTAFQALERQRPLTLRNHDLAALVGEVFAKVDELAHYRGLEARLICPTDHLICAIAPDAVRELLCQLLSNAFKFTPPGGLVTLELAVSQGQVLLSVADTGPGIPPEEQASLFTRWHAAEPPFPPHGAGLGLAICRSIAEAHGGALTLDTSAPQGCRFVFSMPNKLASTNRLSDLPADYSGGFDPCRVALSDVLPPEAFLTK